MNYRFSLLFFTLIFLFANDAEAQYIQIADNYSAQQLVENVLVNSPCAQVSNFSVTGDPYSNLENSYGYFNAAGTTFPFAEGIVLATSRANRTAGPNDNLIDEGSTLWLGDQDLQQALGISNTVNATALEFDFTPLTSRVSFQYIFASEEYQGTAPCRYSDGFAFLLKPVGSTQPYQNLAIIPGTNTPVLVTTVHPIITGSCPAINEQFFGGYNPVESPINFNGQTVPLTATANVIPGQTYHIKLVIADEQNYRYDSAIFLFGGSFDVGIDVGPDRLIATGNPICEGNSYELNATEIGNNTYQWSRNNVAIPAPTGTNPILNVTQTGTYTVNVAIGNTTCVAKGEARVEFSALPVLTNTTLLQCDPDNDGSALYNLTRVNGIITNNNSSLGNVDYFATFSNAQNYVDRIINVTSYVGTADSMVYARVQNQFGCSSIATVLLQTTNNVVTNRPIMTVCDEDPEPISDGIYDFTLSDINPQVVQGLPNGLTVEYYLTEDDAFLDLSPLPNNYRNTTPNLQIIYAKILNGPDCYGVIPVSLKVNIFNPANFNDETIPLCENASVTLSVASGFANYEWSNGETTQNITVLDAGIYSVTVTENTTGCRATKTFTVTAVLNPKILNIEISDFNANGNTVTVFATGDGVLQYSIDGENFQLSPVFTNVSPGEYDVVVNSDTGCEVATQNIFVLGYPKFFTPNGDGYNDIWYIKNLGVKGAMKGSIFDRYGKLLYFFDQNSGGWNGIFNGKPLPSEDYWFVLDFESGRIVRGHFALKR